MGTVHAEEGDENGGLTNQMSTLLLANFAVNKVLV